MLISLMLKQRDFAKSNKAKTHVERANILTKLEFGNRCVKKNYLDSI
jgi:hypothetical protein